MICAGPPKGALACTFHFFCPTMKSIFSTDAWSRRYDVRRIEAISKTSVSVKSVLGKPYKWLESYVTKDKIYCVHEAESEDVIREHSSCASFPVNKVEEVKVIISPATAE